MPSVGSNYLSNTEVEVITQLFIFRSGTAEQVSYMIQPESAEKISEDTQNRSNYSGRTKYIANTLNRLVKKGLVAVMKTAHSLKYVYYLTNEGLNSVYTVHGIEDYTGSLASGWSGDYGFFDYSLYKPSQDRFAHHDLTVNFHIQMMHYAAKNQSQYEFIDNRYASREFSSIKQGKKVKRYFRPDGEFKINFSNHYWLEIDMSTERGEKLADKFESYREYLDVISEGISFSEINETPRTIVFHSSATYIAIRWVSVLNAFMSKMERYTPLINFILTNHSNLDRAANAEVNRERHLNILLNNMKTYLKRESGFIGLPDTRSSHPSFIKLLETDEEVLGWSPNLILVDNSDGTKQILLFERMEGFESIGLARIIDFTRRFKNLEIGRNGQVNEVIPVLYYYDVAPEESPFKGAGLEMDVRRIFSKLMLHDAKNNLWYDGIDRKEIANNPLMYRRH